MTTSRRMRGEGHVAYIREKWNADRGLVGELEGKVTRKT
jgi:hypothetical protein